MTNKATIVIAASIAAASLASPAFAQSADRTGSQMPYYYGSDGGQVRGSWSPQAAQTPQATTTYRQAAARSSGLRALAMNRRGGRSKIPSAGQH